jgi:hypothetical protein
MTRIGRILLLAVAVTLFLFAVPTFASNVTVSGTVNFSSLDGSVDDEDGVVNGVFTVSGDLIVNGTISCIDDSGRESGCSMSFDVGHDLIVNAGGAIFSENRTGTGSGGAITFTVGEDLIMNGPTTTLAGAVVSSASTSSSGSNGGNITATVSGAATIAAGATIDAGSANAVAGNVSITAGGAITANGNVLAGPSRTILSSRLTDAALSGGTGNQVGGAITLKSTSLVQPGVTVGSNANVVSQGQRINSGPVILEGCGVVVNGLVASLAYKDATARVAIRSGKTIDVDGRDLGVTGATLGRNGTIRGDAPTGTALNHTVDLFAFGNISVLGPDPAESTLYAISGTPGVHDSKSDGATVRIISLTGGVTASGNVVRDGHAASGDDGGNVSVSSQGDVNLDHGVLSSIGDSSTSNATRGGGTITVRSYSGNVVWTNGTGDVRPVGSSSGLTTGQGVIALTACGTINLAGSTFPTIGPPVGTFPSQTTGVCSPAAPSLPAGEPALPICCNTIVVINPAVTDGTAGTPFSQTFTQTGAIGTAAFTLFSGTLPAGLTLSTSGVLSGTPTVVGTFPIVVQVTDSQGCTGVGPTYNLVIHCQTITVTNPSTTTTVAGSPFSVTFTQSGGIGTTTFSTSSTLPAGLSLSSAGVLSGTPTQTGTFPIVVMATDSNGCTGSGATYNLTVTCQTIIVTNPANSSGTVSSPFSATFTQSGAIGTATFSTGSVLPAGLSLSSAGVLSGTPTQTGSFPIVVTVTDSNGCTGTGATYTLVIGCQTITVNNPSNSSGTVDAAFSETFTQSGAIGTTTFSTASTLPTGLSLSSAGVLSGTPTQTGSFPIVVTVTDSNGCTGTGATYTLVIACNMITVNNPATSSGTAGVLFSVTFTQSGGHGTINWSESGALPSGITLSASTGVLSGTTSQTGTFPIVVTATDANGCSGSSSYSFTINCQSITVTNPANGSATASTPFSETFTASGILGSATWSFSGTLPSGLSLNASTGVLSGTPTQTGTFTITVTATDTNGCSGTGAAYTITVVCPTITVTRVGGGSFPPATFGVGYPAGNQLQATGGSGNYHWAFAPGGQPPGINITIAAGTLSGIPTATGTFTMVVVATDQVTGCTGQASFTFTILPKATADSYANLVGNTQAVVTGGTTATPSTPAVPLSGRLTANDLPSGGVTITTVGTFATTAGGSVQIAADGTFLYTPPVTFFPLTSDSFSYTISSDTGGTGIPTSASATATLNLVNRVWYVNPNAISSGNGQSQSPWNNTSAIFGTFAGDIIFVYDNGGSTANTSTGISLVANQTLWGQGVTLIVNGFTLVSGSSAQAPTLTATSPAGNVVTVNNGNTIQGVILTNATNSLIAGSPTGLTVQSSTLRPTGTANGIALTSAGGTITLNNVTTNGAGSGDAIKVTGGTATWSVSNSPTLQTNGRAINVTATTGGSMTFDSASTLTVSSGTTDGAMSFSNNSITFTFNGNVALTVSGSARGLLASSNGGTVNITGAASTISAAGAAAVDFQNSTIGAGGLNFRSVDATGGINGIVLNATGSFGGLTVAGNGGTCTSTLSTCTGGTIQGSTGSAISLTSTQSPSFSFMKITNAANSGVYGTTVTNFTLSNSVIDGVNTAHTATDGNVSFNLSAGGATENNLSGAVSITSNTLNNSFQNGIDILNYAGTISSLTITGNSLTSSTLAANSLGTAISVVANRGASAAQIGGGSISGNTIANFPSGAGIRIIGGNTAAGPAVAIASLASPLLIQDNSVTGAAPGAGGLGTNGIQTTIGHQSAGFFTIGASGHPNSIRNVRGNAIACSLFGTGTEKCTIAFNTVVANNTAGSPGINTGADQATGSGNTGTLYLDIHDNNVSQTVGNGILATVRNVSSSGIFHIENNIVARPTVSSGTIYGIRVDSGNGLGASSICLKISGNTTAGSTNGTTTAPGIGLRVQHTGTTSTMQIDGLTPATATDGGPMETYVGNTGQNPGSANGTFGINGVFSISAGATYTASTCTIP